MIHASVKRAVLRLLYIHLSRSVCVSGHQNFVTLPYGKRLKINLVLNSSLVNLYYAPNYDPKPRLLLEKGEFTSASGVSYSFGILHGRIVYYIRKNMLFI